MFVKRLELTGFKSFPDPAEVSLHSGVTAVVGPNGCGKSNLLDAIRWVLGEQKVRLLRGAKMEEIIFAGTRERPPVNVAEVQLVIDNRSGFLKSEYTEVAIARRLYRSGESEYLINRNPCRLKDIQDMIMDTGLGSHAYSVIQQGMVDAIISEKHEDRRLLFEEAAGVAKYKHRKQAAIRKLDNTENDLVRLQDVASELGRRVRSLARQKGSASRHNKLSERLRDLEITGGTIKYRHVASQLNEIVEKLRIASTEAARATGAVNELQLKWEKARLESDRAEKLQNEASDTLAETTQKLHEAQQEELRLTERVTHNQESLERGEERRQHLTSRLEDARHRLQETGEQAQSARKELTEARENVSTLEQKYAAASEHAKTARQQAGEANDSFREQERKLERAKSEADADRRVATEVTNRLSMAQKNCEVIAQQLREIEQEFERSERSIAEAERSESELGEQQSEIDGSIESLRNTLAELDKERQSLSETLSGLNEKHRVLADLVNRGEGLGKAAEALVAEYGNRGLRGWVDELSPESEWCTAVEVALGDRLGLLWSPDNTAIDGALYRLRDDSIGRAALLDSTLRNGNHVERPTVDDDGFCGWLDDKVRAEGSAAEWISPLLGGIATARDDESARRVFECLKRNHAVVTPQGTFYGPPGVVMTGMENSESLVGRSDRLSELAEEITQLRAKRDQCEQSQSYRRDELSALQAERHAAERNIAAMRNRLAEMRLLRERLDARRQELSTRKAEFEQETSRLREQLSDYENRLGEREREQTEFGFMHGQLDANRADREEDATCREEEARRIGVALNDARVRFVEVSARAEAAVADSERLTEMIAETESELATLSERAMLIQNELEQLTADVQSIQERVSICEIERTERESVRSEARTVAAATREAYAAIDTELREERRKRETLLEDENTLKVERARIDSTLTDIRERLQEKYNSDPAEVTLDESCPSGEELTAKIEDVKRKIERIGPVNVLAVEEYEREKERLDFIEKQVADLRAAKKSLLETIGELNETAGQRFLETFEVARRNFQNVFGELFRGGEADVRLTDSSQPLDSPIEIFARPRGKKFIGLRQLSGGERALTALAMLFGLYLVKPSPFCILDEVDAPLDDANCGRFLRLIDKFKNKTQFIIITHNKMTMESADTLYGVTMERPGISQLVSVRLNRAAGEPESTPGEAKPLAEPRIELDGGNGDEADEQPSADETDEIEARFEPVVNRIVGLSEKIDREPRLPVIPDTVSETEKA